MVNGSRIGLCRRLDGPAHLDFARAPARHRHQGRRRELQRHLGQPRPPSRWPGTRRRRRDRPLGLGRGRGDPDLSPPPFPASSRGDSDGRRSTSTGSRATRPRRSRLGGGRPCSILTPQAAPPTAPRPPGSDTDGTTAHAVASADRSRWPGARRRAPTITNMPASATFGGGFTATVSTANGDGTQSVTSNSPGVCTVGATA